MGMNWFCYATVGFLNVSLIENSGLKRLLIYVFLFFKLSSQMIKITLRTQIQSLASSFTRKCILTKSSHPVLCALFCLY